MNPNSKIGLVLLAAGASSRMGQSKQLLSIEGEPLLLRTIRSALAAEVSRVVVILGAEQPQHQSVIQHLPVDMVYNDHWQNGMGSSIKKGLNSLISSGQDCDAVLIIVCDQPLLTVAHLNNLIDHYQKNKNGIIASYYSEAAGVPALFAQSFFPALLELEDEQGAKKIIQKHFQQVVKVPFAGGEIDLDTRDEYEKFISYSN